MRPKPTDSPQLTKYLLKGEYVLALHQVVALLPDRAIVPTACSSAEPYCCCCVVSAGHRVTYRCQSRRFRLQKSLTTMAHLPVRDHAKLLVDTIKANPVTVVMAETGSGKTTQLPQVATDQAPLAG